MGWTWIEWVLAIWSGYLGISFAANFRDPVVWAMWKSLTFRQKAASYMVSFSLWFTPVAFLLEFISDSS
jgi:hypothetical protein